MARNVSASNGGMGLNRSTSASSGSAVIRGGRDALQIHNTVPVSTMSAAAQCLSFTILFLILLCLSFQAFVVLDIKENSLKQRETIEHIYEMRQIEQAEKHLGRVTTNNMQNRILPIFFPTLYSN